MRLPSYQDLSKEQDRINDLPADGRHLVIGPPGTGKTVMALYRAAMLKKRRRKSMLLMRSRLLKQYTVNAAEDLLLDGQVETYDSWLGSFFFRNYRRYAPQLRQFVYDYEEILATVAKNPPKPGAITDLLVDEGQDLQKEFYILTSVIAPHVTVFADENQRLTDTNATVVEIKTYGKFPEPQKLTRNYRNTVEIARLAAEFYTGLKSGIPDLPTRAGELPTLRAWPSRTAFIENLRRYEKTNSDLSIGVVAPTGKSRDRIARMLGTETVNPVQVYVGGKGKDAVKVDFERSGIIVVHYQSAKGLEFDTLFAPDLDEFMGGVHTPETKMTLYVLFSRARDHLHISYVGHDEPAVLSLIPRHLVEEL
jgi:superfamily I DNA/RNA helicase